MSAQARKTSRYHQHLPSWIYDTAAWASLRQQHRATLQAVADCCSPELDDQDRPTGNLTGCIGGQRLAERAGVPTRTLTRHLTILIRTGLVVPTFVPDIRAMRMAKKPLANIYGVPGRSGGLDHKRAQQRKRPYAKRADGRAVPQHLKAGDQSELFAKPSTGPQGGPKATPTGAGAGETAGSVACKSVLPPRSKWPTPLGQSGRPNHTHNHPLRYKNHGGGASQSGGGDGRATKQRKPKCPHVSAEQLPDLDALIALQRECHARGVPGTGGEAGLHWIVCAAELALAEADKPAAFFAWLINFEKKLRITQSIEDRARVKLRDHLHPDAADSQHRQHLPRGDVLPEHRPAPKSRELSKDAKSAAAIVGLARLKKADAFALACLAGEKRGDPWTRERWDAALAEFQNRHEEATSHA